jgi:hypothetical protein
MDAGLIGRVVLNAKAATGGRPYLINGGIFGRSSLHLSISLNTAKTASKSFAASPY